MNVEVFTYGDANVFGFNITIFRYGVYITASLGRKGIDVRLRRKYEDSS